MNTTLKLSEFEMNALIEPYKLSQAGSILNKNKKVTDICIGDNGKQRKAAILDIMKSHSSNCVTS